MKFVFRCTLTSKYSTSNFRYNLRNVTKNQVNSKCNSSKHINNLYALSGIGVVLSGGCVLNLISNRVSCEPNRMQGFRYGHNKDLKFDWYLLWKYLAPHIWHFVAAIFVSIFKCIILYLAGSIIVYDVFSYNLIFNY